jgi:hypothetical protein
VVFDDALALPDLINITEAATADLNGHPRRIYPAGTILLEDWGYVDYGLFDVEKKAHRHIVKKYSFLSAVKFRINYLFTIFTIG